MSASAWKGVSATSPCPICKSTSWCSTTTDGTVAKCMRVSDGCYRSKEDRSGNQYYLHRLVDRPTPTAGHVAGPRLGRADADVLHAVYSLLLDMLTLSPAHREALTTRGFGDLHIDRNGYRTLPVHGRARLAAQLQERFGDVVLQVPGIVRRNGNSGSYLTIAGAAGLLVPIRDLAGRIVALLSRRDDTSDGRGKYLYLSSATHGGPSPGAPIHVPLGVTGPCAICRLTEGALKADLAFARSGVPTLGAAGLAWRPAVDVLRELQCQTTRLAFDADARDKPPVARALAASVQAFSEAGWEIEYERWPSEFKGIDDALAAGATVEVLTGDDARRAVAGVVAEGTAAEPPSPPDPLDRLAEVLAAGGADALFRDKEVLQALARLAEADPAEFACRRAQLQRADIKLRDLDRALTPLRKAIRRDRPPADAAGQYRISGGRIVRDASTRDGVVETPLATWHGRIVEEIIRDDGAEQSVVLAIEGGLSDGTPLPRVEVPADEFASMRWPVKRWGTRAVVLAGAAVADHLRAALQLLSGDVPRRTVFAHTGWREVDSGWVYLHGGGAIGGNGPVEGVAVSLPEALAGYLLPDPPTGADLVSAFRASLRLLEVAPDHIAGPLLGGVYRAVLGPCDCALHLAGPTGAGKSELAALAQQHFGAGLDARHLPASWSSTGNALEVMAFAAKDAVMTVDDFAPGGSAADVSRHHREADRLLRAQGNHAGRMRLRSDASPRPARPPRGLILSTGEDVPRGQSLRARLLTLELAPGETNWCVLTECQADAAAGRLAAAMAAYLRWLAPQYAAVRAGLRDEVARLRSRARVEGGHARTPGILADLAIGWQYWLDFAVAAGAIDAGRRAELNERVWAALERAGIKQVEHLATAEPCGQFLRLLSAALASGRAHVAAADGNRPEHADSWGWRPNGAAWEPQGRRIGWIEAEDFYLEPEAAFAEAQEMARHQADSLPISARTLRKRLNERGLLESTDPDREVLTVRKTLEGRRREVMHLRAAHLTAPEPDRPDQPTPEREKTGRATGRVDGRVMAEEETNPTAGPDHNEGGNTCAVGLVGSNTSQATGGGPDEFETRPPTDAKLYFIDTQGRSCRASEAVRWTWEGGPRWYDVATEPPPNRIGDAGA
jgi:hypothetical protein